MTPLTKTCEAHKITYDFFFMIEGCPVCDNESHIEQLEFELADCESDIKERDEQITDLRNTIDENDNTITDLENKIEDLEEVEE